MQIQKYAPIGAFIAMSLRCIVFSASIGDSFVLFALSALLAYQFFLESKKELPINDNIKLQIGELKDAVNALKMGKSLGRN